MHNNSELALDFEHVEMLREIMADEFDALLKQFLADSEACVEGAKQAAHAEDWDALRRHAHTLKGSAANLGAPQLAQLCGALEHHVQSAAQRNPDTMLSMLAEIHSVCNVTRSALEALL